MASLQICSQIIEGYGLGLSSRQIVAICMPYDRNLYPRGGANMPIVNSDNKRILLERVETKQETFHWKWPDPCV